MQIQVFMNTVKVEPKQGSVTPFKLYHVYFDLNVFIISCVTFDIFKFLVNAYESAVYLL